MSSKVWVNYKQNDTVYREPSWTPREVTEESNTVKDTKRMLEGQQIIDYGQQH